MTTRHGYPSPHEQLHATYWLLRIVIGLGPILVGLDELTTRAGSVVHQGLALPQEISTTLAVVEMVAGLAVVAGVVRAGASIVGALFAALTVSLLAVDSALALKVAMLAACAFGLVRLEGLMRSARMTATSEREVNA